MELIDTGLTETVTAMGVNRTSLLFFALLLTISTVISLSDVVSAHPGRTDSSGGHTCRTNCESWGLDYGEYHYHNGGGGGGTGGLSEAAQARVAAADFAMKDDRARIESIASADGKRFGEQDGLAGTSTYADRTDSENLCTQVVKFSTQPSATYSEAFQSTYTRVCKSVYRGAYWKAYYDARESAAEVRKANIAKEAAEKAEQKKAEDTKNRNNILLTSGAIGSAIAGISMWNKYKLSAKK